MRLSTFPLLAIAVACSGCGDSSSSTPSRTPEDVARGELLEALVEEYVDANIEPDDPGLAYVVIGPRGAVAEGAFGMADLERELAITLETPFEAGSVAKQFTAMGAMLLIEAGLLGLDDPIANELPEVPAEWDGVTIEQLLLHTSGIRNLEAVSSPEREDWSNEDVLEWAITQPLGGVAGAEFNYTNTGYALLALIIERVSEKPFDVFMKERIFDPLRMSNSGVDPVWPPDIPDRAVSYLLDTVTEVDGGGTGWAAQHTTIEDMKRWEAELREVTLVSPDTLGDVFTAHVPAPTGDEKEPPNYAACGYGYGWDVCDQAGLPPEVGHSGEYSTFHAWFRRFPEEQVAVLVFTNGSNSSGNVFWGFALAESLAQAYFNEPLPE